MLDLVLLTAVQSRILLALMMDGSLGTASLLRAVGISGRTWAKEKRRLESLGLLTAVNEKKFTKHGIRNAKLHYLTNDGFKVASLVKEISIIVERTLKNKDVTMPPV
jgi:hypothetical protein